MKEDIYVSRIVFFFLRLDILEFEINFFIIRASHIEVFVNANVELMKKKKEKETSAKRVVCILQYGVKRHNEDAVDARGGGRRYEAAERTGAQTGSVAAPASLPPPSFLLCIEYIVHRPCRVCRFNIENHAQQCLTLHPLSTIL